MAISVLLKFNFKKLEGANERYTSQRDTTVIIYSSFPSFTEFKTNGYRISGVKKINMMNNKLI